MTDDLGELERRLELATARHCPAEVLLEPETAGLRAAWLALGEVLEASQPQVELPLKRLPPLPAKPRRRWLAPMVATMATSALIVVTAAWYVRGTKPATAVSPSPAAIANNSHATPSPAKKRAAAASRDAELAWDDSLDQEIALAGQAIALAQRDRFASAPASNRVQYQMETLGKELDDNPL